MRASPESDEISFNLNTTYAVTPDVNLYARIAKGYRAPSIQGRLLLLDTLAMQWRDMRVPRDPACPVCGARPLAPAA